MNTSGFYHRSNLTHKASVVHGPGYTLSVGNEHLYIYPVDDWTWYATVEEAAAAFGVDVGAINLEQSA